MAKRKRKSGPVAVIEKLIKKVGVERYVLRLYVTGSTPKSSAAISNIRSLCEEHLAGRYDLEVIDLYQQPAEAKNAEIIAAPTLVKKFPEPPRRMVGDLSNKDRVLVGLNLQPSPNDDSPLQSTAGPIKWVQL